MGVDENTVEFVNQQTEEPARIREERYQQLMNAYLPILVAAGKLMDTRLEQDLNAELPILVAAGKFTDARLEQ